MKTNQIKKIQGEEIEMLEILLTSKGNELRLLWKIRLEHEIFSIVFYNVSRLKMGTLSVPLVVHGVEIIDHSQSGWETDSKYEIRDFEENCIHFFCEKFEIHN